VRETCLLAAGRLPLLLRRRMLCRGEWQQFLRGRNRKSGGKTAALQKLQRDLTGDAGTGAGAEAVASANLAVG
jgi:hypothetical protein